MDWEQEYERKIISGDEAASEVKSGDLVAIPMGVEPTTICYALAVRKDELKGVRVSPAMAARDFGWYDLGWEDYFLIEAMYVMPIMGELFSQKKADYSVVDMLILPGYDVRADIDVLLITVSPPNQHGYCSFGGSVWNKPNQVKMSKLVIAEINPHQIRTYGRNTVHVSEIDYFVEHIPLGTTSMTRDMTGRVIAPPGEAEKAIAGHISTLIKDGDTLMLGIGGATEYIEELGAFEGKRDLGIHTEILPPAFIRGMQKGIFTGARKTLHPGKAICTAVGGERDDYAFVAENPAIELYESTYVLDPRVVASNDNMVSIASAFAIDLTGQVATDSIGFRMMAGTGGSVPFAIGTRLSKGGRIMFAMTSTTSTGISRIVSQFEPGTVVTIPRWLTDYVVTEYGIARLRGKTQRDRAIEMTSIAHPDFRAKLKKEAEKAFWP